MTIQKRLDVEELFKKIIKDEEQLFTSELVIAEIIWVLESYYGLSKEDVKEKIEKILNTKNLFCPNKDILYESLALYLLKNIDFIDAYNSLIMKQNNISEIYSYDLDFDRLDGVRRIEP